MPDERAGRLFVDGPHRVPKLGLHRVPLIKLDVKRVESSRPSRDKAGDLRVVEHRYLRVRVPGLKGANGQTCRLQPGAHRRIVRRRPGAVGAGLSRVEATYGANHKRDAAGRRVASSHPPPARRPVIKGAHHLLGEETGGCPAARATPGVVTTRQTRPVPRRTNASTARAGVTEARLDPGVSVEKDDDRRSCLTTSDRST